MQCTTRQVRLSNHAEGVFAHTPALHSSAGKDSTRVSLDPNKIEMTGIPPVNEASHLTQEGGGVDYGKGIRNAYNAGDEHASRSSVE